ncbi:hypothetical protein BCR35DRAFT_279395 [Leucosporidium creatinivorum]|uniref:DUF726-domain-containing protein n=1 Tax=Leucosporidium creatinivorum TaxID=106004 RepID=A0A1Y2F8N2_9BASI|nr:hypothetical protein BCR35DRAFT_279395 [Leucosporidium creatinivorum]
MALNDLDDEEWQDMPVILPTTSTTLDDEDRKRYHWHSSPSSRLDSAETSTFSALAGGSGVGNATGRLIDVDAGGQAWKEKEELDEMDYTRLELDDDPEEDEISMRTQYLFNEDKGMTPLSQMQATKTLLTEGQRIAYVGLCRLVAREMVQTLALASKGAKELEPARQSAQNWGNKIMGRLYRHMEVDGAEQRMIEQLAEHGVTAEDLVPSLVTTYTVENPEYDPEAAFTAAQETEEQEKKDAEEAERIRIEEEEKRQADEEAVLAAAVEKLRLEEEAGRVAREVARIERRESAARDPFGQEESDPRTPPRSPSVKSFRSPSLRSPSLKSPTSPHAPKRFESWDDGGDIGGALDPVAESKPLEIDTSAASSLEAAADITTPTSPPPAAAAPTDEPPTPKATPPTLEVETPSVPSTPLSPTHQPDNFLTPLPSSLPGVSTTLSTADKLITLDIRWTILCDLFLSLIADSVYDARSRVLLGQVADKLGLAWIDVVRFERRLTEALEIQESVANKEHAEVLEDRAKKSKKSRYMMMGLATLGGGLVIGLSAGLLAPVIGAGLGAALTTVGVTGTSGFLAGAGGAAIISSGATLTGMSIGGRAMAKRTRNVKTFDFLPLHNNKRVNFFITVPGFMNGPLDDVRLPFSTIDPLMGDVFSVLWEPEMMGDTGNALKILSSEVLTQAGQQVLALTVMTALMSALQWPMMLTKLSYLIDNPWSNALDRARQAGVVLADILINRRLGVRPVSLVGFSLGARVIFYALVELAKANAFGVVQEVYLFGATVTASKKVWRQVRGVVSGRFVNAFAMNDWVLGYLFRATSGGLQTVAGLRPIDHVPDLENVDITSILVGHMSYRTLMPTLLAHVGFKTTADHFDEPEEMEQDAPEREVLTKEEEARRAKKERKKGLGIFSRKKTTSSAPMSRTPSGDYDDLPPRLSSSSSTSVNTLDAGKDIGSSKLRSASSLSVATTDSAEAEGYRRSASMDRPSGVDTPPSDGTPDGPSVDSSPMVGSNESTIGFDLEKLRAEVAQLPNSAEPPHRPSSTPQEPPQHYTPTVVDDVVTRSTSAPPVSQPPPQTDLTALDTTLDPRELLRRQWAGEMVTPTGTSFSSATDDDSGWGAPASNPFASSSTSTFTFPSEPPLSLRHQPSFTFGDSNGFLHQDDSSLPPISVPDEPAFTFADSNGDVSWSSPADEEEARRARERSSFEDGAPDPAAKFAWGGANASTASFKLQNPW